MTTIADMITGATARRRDYSLTGPEAARAEEAGLVNARWFTPNLKRKDLKALMQRRDGPALRDTAIWFASLAAFGGLGAVFCSLPWARITHILAGLKAVRYQIWGRTIVQRTKIRQEAAEILKNLGISAPKKLLAVTEPPQAQAAA